MDVSRRTRWMAGATAAAAAVSAVGLSSSTGATAGSGSATQPVARNVIYVQGDGMGITQREFLRLALAGRTGELRMKRSRPPGWSTPRRWTPRRPSPTPAPRPPPSPAA